MKRGISSIIMSFIVSMILFGCGSDSEVEELVTESKTTSVEQSTESVSQNDSIDPPAGLATEDIHIGFSGIWGEIKDTYRETAKNYGESLKESYGEVVAMCKDAFLGSDIYESSVKPLRESYDMLYGEESSLLGSLGKTKDYIKAIMHETSKEALQKGISSIENPELKEIMKYALVAKDIRTNYSDYSVENVTPEFKEKMDRIEKLAIEIIAAYQADDAHDKTLSLSEYKDVLDAAADLEHAYTGSDTLSQADREYFDIVMLRIAGMIIAVQAE